MADPCGVRGDLIVDGRKPPFSRFFQALWLLALRHIYLLHDAGRQHWCMVMLECLQSNACNQYPAGANIASVFSSGFALLCVHGACSSPFVCIAVSKGMDDNPAVAHFDWLERFQMRCFHGTCMGFHCLSRYEVRALGISVQ